MIVSVKRVKLTWNVLCVNFRTGEVYSVYVHFSLHDPWLFPRYDPHFGSIDVPLCGWLFFYFGRDTEGVVCRTDDADAPFTDRKGRKYHMLAVKDRHMRDAVRAVVKARVPFHVEYHGNKDGVAEASLVLDCRDGDQGKEGR